MLDEVFREEWGRLLAALVGMLGDIELAEEVAQEAFVAAAERWPKDGLPTNPAGWLVVTARNRAIDRIRRERTHAQKIGELRWLTGETTEDAVDEVMTFPDERLELIFTCCHPALAPESQVALTLRTLGGLSTEEIARGFLVPFETMSKRLTRAKHKIRDAGIPFEVPPDHLLPPRDWREIALLYEVLFRLTGSPIVEMNRAVAIAETDGAEAALDVLDSLSLDDYRYYHSARADFLRRAGRNTEARSAYARALELTQTDPERRFLEGRILELTPRTSDDWDEFWTYTLNELKEQREREAFDADVD